MGKYMEWYEVEFEAAARNRLSPERARDILESLREHVEYAKQELLAHGDEEAERLAVRKLGAPLDIVFAELDTPKRQWWPVYAAIVGLVVSGGGLIVGSRGIPFYLEVFPLWATPLAVFLLSLFGKRIKLWALFGATAGAAVVMAILLAFTWLRLESAGGMGYVSMWQVNSESGLAKRKLRHLDSVTKYVERARAAFRADNREAAAALTYTANGWTVPNSGSESFQGFSHLRSGDYEKARLLWTSRSEHVLSVIGSEIRRHEAQVSAMNSPSAHDPKRIMAENLPPLCAVMVAVYSILASAHLIGLAVANIPKGLARRRWRATRT